MGHEQRRIILKYWHYCRLWTKMRGPLGCQLEDQVILTFPSRAASFLVLTNQLASPTTISINVFVVQVDEKMQVLTKEGGEVVPNLYCIGDANGKLMLAHAASAHGVRCATRYSHTVRRVVRRVFRVSWIAFGCPGRVT